MTNGTLRTRPGAISATGWGWRHATRTQWALRDLELRIEPGERVLLLGASGSGKSTLLRGVAGILGGEEEGVEEGQLRIDGASATGSRGRVGLLLQDPDSHLVLSRLGDDIAFGCENLGVPREEIWRRVPEALAAVGLQLPLEQQTGRLSGGQKQRAGLAGILAMRPGVVLLDEPTANLDPDGVSQVIRAVADLLDAAGPTLLVVEHRIEPWLPLIDRVVALGRDGSVIADGAPATVLEGHRSELVAHGVWVPGWRTAPVSSPSEAGAIVLEASGVAVARHRDRPVLANVDTELHAGRALAITGPNGAGKSTLALALGGLAAPVAGEVRASASLADGLARQPHRWRSRDLVSRIGSVFQDPEHQFLTGSVRAELELGPRLISRARNTAAGDLVEELLFRLRLDDVASANPFTLSGGQKRRLSVATALVTRPPLLILDEPTYGQDLQTWGEMLTLLAELRAEGHCLAVVSHDEHLVAALADEVLQLSAGRQVPR